MVFINRVNYNPGHLVSKVSFQVECVSFSCPALPLSPGSCSLTKGDQPVLRWTITELGLYQEEHNSCYFFSFFGLQSRYFEFTEGFGGRILHKTSLTWILGIGSGERLLFGYCRDVLTSVFELLTSVGKICRASSILFT